MFNKIKGTIIGILGLFFITGLIIGSCTAGLFI